MRKLRLRQHIQDKKLKKEENLDLIKKLAKSRVDTSLLRSSRSLGAEPSKREVLSQALKESKAGVNVEENHGLLFEEHYDESDDSEVSGSLQPTEIHHLPLEASAKPAFGSGLKRPLENGIDGKPVIKQRKRLKKTKTLPAEAIDLPWEGFSSDDGSNSSFHSLPTRTASINSQTDSEEEHSAAFDETADTSDSESPTEDSENEDYDPEERKERSSAFKAWATSQVNEALGFKPTADISTTSRNVPSSEQPTHVPRAPELEPLPPELEVTSNAPERKAFSVKVERPPGVQEARFNLPVVGEEQKIMEAIYNNPTIVIWGATGSGKTTQVPQFLYEAGFGNPDSPNPRMIGVTQPRRVAAVSMAKRVGDELGNVGEKVSYQIRFDSSVSNKTAIKFMTDGILIREIATDFALLKYSIIIIDEAHERSANTDILIGMVSRIVDLRATMSRENENIKPLKLVIMSATLRITDFLENPNLFRNSTPPLIQAEGRQYPVTIHFARRTQRDYLEEAFEKVCKGHRKLPPGGILVFLTGQNEITALANRLNKALTNLQGDLPSSRRVRISASEVPLESEDLELGNGAARLDDWEDDEEESNGDPFDTEGDQDFEIEDSMPAISKVHILPLYSQLQTKDQLRVFEPPPENSRIIVLATNVAETSLTIPGIRYVFDCGRAKEKKYDRLTGVQSFEVNWISKASANQRAGRAGRTGPGHCYRLYSSAVYERDFEEHSEPEILRMPVEGVVLQLKSMDLQHVVNFPFPTPPDRHSLLKAEKLLTYLGAVTSEGKITSVGRELSNYPLSPRFSKMLTIGHQHDCMPYTVALVAALASLDLFIPENQLGIAPPTQPNLHITEDRPAEEARTQLKSDYNHAHHLFSRHSSTSDALKGLTALCAYAHAPSKDDFCKDMFLSPKALSEASNLCTQLMSIARNNNPTLLSANLSLKLPSPSKTQIAALQQFTAAAFIDQIAILASAFPSPPDLPRKPTRAIDVPYFPLFPINTKRRADTDIVDIAVFVHPSSVLAHIATKDLPIYVIYSHLQRGTPATIEGAKKPRTRMNTLTAVTAKQIAALAKGTPLLVYGKPIGKIEERDSKTRTCWVVPSLVGEKGSMGWPLPAQKVVQMRDGKGEWIVEKVVG